MSGFSFSVEGLSEEFINGVRILIIHQTDAPHNRITPAMGHEVHRWFTDVSSYADTQGIVVMSEKPGCFLAGVDVTLFDEIHTAQEAQKAAKDLQDLFNAFAQSSIPTVAAIHGVCLGGGMEWALACHARICSSDAKTQFGLPEVQLGLLPGAGGTQRLPRLIGLADSFEIILGGKKIHPKRALQLGLVTDVVPADQLKQKAIQQCLQLKKHNKETQKSLTASLSMAAQESFIGRKILEQKAKDNVLKKTKGLYPAPLKALEVMVRGIALPLPEALNLEAQAFGELFVTPESKALRYVFKMMNAGKKNPFEQKIQTQGQTQYVQRILQQKDPLCVLGAGFMGTGIATNALQQNLRVSLFDKNQDSLQRSCVMIDSFFWDLVKKKRLKKHEALGRSLRLQPLQRLHNTQSSPIVIEAAFEELGVKHDILKQWEQMAQGHSPGIFASNTSSIPIAQVASASQTPERVVGMHFFSPVPKMPFVEVIMGSKTAPEVGSAVVDLALALGKHIIVVNDGPGFYTTRILAFLIAEALNLVAEGASVEEVDGALESFGMAVGPLTLLDEVGIDIGAHIVTTLNKSFAERLVIPDCIADILAEKRLGRKTGLGFYTYESEEHSASQKNPSQKGTTFKRLGVDQGVYKYFKNRKSGFQMNAEQISKRVVLAFVNEAGRCLEERIISNPMAGDLGAVFGLGFPPFRGGPFFYAQQLGYKPLMDELRTLSSLYGPRFKPSEIWAKL